VKKQTAPGIDTTYFINEKPIGLLASAVASKYQHGFLMRLTHDRVFSSVTSSDHAVLRLLAFDSLTSVELSRRLGISKQAVGKTVSALEQRGFIERQEGKTDKREHVLVMTDKGSKLVAKSIEVAKELERATEKLLGRESFSLLKTLLSDIANSTDLVPSSEAASGQDTVSVSAKRRRSRRA
jgi:DNA-binding MarR family transcriptional regulator